jgi:hypothetical protein
MIYQVPDVEVRTNLPFNCHVRLRAHDAISQVHCGVHRIVVHAADRAGIPLNERCPSGRVAVTPSRLEPWCMHDVGSNPCVRSTVAVCFCEGPPLPDVHRTHMFAAGSFVCGLHG